LPIFYRKPPWFAGPSRTGSGTGHARASDASANGEAAVKIDPSERRRVALLGATGSIGTQTLDLAERHPERIEIVALAGGRQVEKLAERAVRHQPQAVCVGAPELQDPFRQAVGGAWDGALLAGEEGLRELAVWPGVSVVVNAVVGAAGLAPSLSALRAGKRLALANKESLVMAGHLIIAARDQSEVELIPIDSEHSAIFQCLAGRPPEAVRRVYITASGGPFRTRTSAQLQGVTPADALKHPTWQMGQRITIDSATLFNKGMELIEAAWLFGLSLDDVRVWVHPQSIVHALVELRDGSLITQMANPDMRLPIQIALAHPGDWGAVVEPCDLAQVGRLEFEPPDPGRFPCLRLAQEAARTGGTAPAVANAADEILVERFLTEEIGFLGIPEGIEALLMEHQAGSEPSFDEVMAADRWARAKAAEWTPSGAGLFPATGGR